MKTYNRITFTEERPPDFSKEAQYINCVFMPGSINYPLDSVELQRNRVSFDGCQFVGEICADKIQTLWLCIKYTGGEAPKCSWEIRGIFDSEDKAKAACITWEYCIGPLVLNHAFPDETVPWDGAYYPIERTE